MVCLDFRGEMNWLVEGGGLMGRVVGGDILLHIKINLFSWLYVCQSNSSLSLTIVFPVDVS